MGSKYTGIRNLAKSRETVYSPEDLQALALACSGKYDENQSQAFGLYMGALAELA